MTLVHTPLLAALVTPALFVGGAAAMAAPILIHLLARRRFKRIRWAAMDFLVDAERRNRRRVRMEDLVLMLLRCAAVLLLGLLMARPFVQPGALAAALGGSQRTERVFLLDDSFSMAYQSPDGTPFTRAREAVKRIIEAVRRDAPDDTVTLIRMADPSRPVEAGAFLDSAQSEAFFARLEALSPSERPLNLTGSVEATVEALRRSPGVTNATIYVVSDFQQRDWGRGDATDDGGASSGGAFAALSDWAVDGRNFRLVMVNVGEKDPANAAIEELTVRSGQLVAGAGGFVRVTVANHSPRPLEGATLDVIVGNLARPAERLESLAPGQLVSADIEVDFLRAGFDALRVELSRDDLPLDNVRHAAVEVVNAVRVLIVNGKPAADPYEDEVTFLTTALRPEGELFSGNEVVVVDEAGLDEANLNPFHLVMLANVYRVSEPALDALERFVRQGGGLIIFPGDQVDPDQFNATLGRGGEGLAPAALQEIIRVPDAAHLVVTDRLHPALRSFALEGDPLGLGLVPFMAYFSAVPYGEEIQADDDVPDINEAASQRPQRPARVLARFDHADGHPALVERTFGAGRVLLMTTAADKAWHLWPDHPTYLPFVMEISRHAARRGSGEADWLVGQPVEIILDAAQFEPDIIVRTPAYPNEREAGLTATPDEDGRGLLLRWEHTERSGIYQFVLKRRDGTEVVRPVAVNVDPRESDLTPAGLETLRQSLHPITFEYIDGLDQLRGGVGEGRMELWRLVLLAALLMIVGEQAFAWWCGRRS